MTIEKHDHDAFPPSTLGLALAAKEMTATVKETFEGGLAVSFALC